MTTTQLLNRPFQLVTGAIHTTFNMDPGNQHIFDCVVNILLNYSRDNGKWAPWAMECVGRLLFTSCSLVLHLRCHSLHLHFDHHNLLHKKYT